MVHEIFVGFVGKRDPFREDGSDGPFLTCLKHERFKEVSHILCLVSKDTDSYRRAQSLQREILKHRFCSVEILTLQIDDPTDLLSIYRELRTTLKMKLKNYFNHKLYFFLSSGTPQMQMALLLLASSREIPATLIYQPDPKFSSFPREINLESDIFPQIRPPLSTPSSYISELPQEVIETAESLGIFIGKNSQFRQAVYELYQFAKNKQSVLILGETGTGKEVFAQLYRQFSPYKDMAFRSINITAIPRELFEAELFGYVKGAFTGANKDNPGLVEEAQNGILFLDEVGDLDLTLQVKLLRFIETGEYKRLGSNKIQKAENLICIFATNKNLKELVKRGQFREDLYYRISSKIVHIPPLRERLDDLPALVNFLLEQIAKNLGKTFIITDEAMEKLTFYHYPGNIRELKGILERACSLSSNYRITPDLIEFPEKDTTSHPRELLPEKPYEGFNLEKTCEEIKDWYYRLAYTLSQGKPVQASRLLGCSYANVIKRWKKIGLYDE